jgi:hypothetical protein
VFRDDRQLARACRALLASVRLARLWTTDGPTPEALALLEANGGPLSSGERIMVLAAFALWNGSGELRLAEVVATLDRERMAALCSLLIASREDAVDAWLARHEVKPNAV